MKTAIKLVLVGAALAGGVANAANVNSALTSSTGTTLLLLLQNTTDNDFFFAELTPTLSSLRTPSALQSDTPSQYSVDGTNTTGPQNAPAALDNYTNTNLNNWLAGDGSDSITWAIMAGYQGNGTDQLGQRALAFTSTLAHLALYWDTPTLGGAVGGFGSFVGSINSAVYTNGVSTTTGFNDAFQGADADITFNGASFGSGAALGTAQSLYLAATGGDDGYAANIYKSAYTYTLGLDLVNGGYVLTYDDPVSEVPLPAAVWLLGSGLVGLMGVGRRRKGASQVVGA